ncbi:MAG: GAF domain-containing sensor histidine kinase [Anaerolineales bacterium]|nr:GAF domain-containing sensor histidine kinase [Anaerolineales bacterium]
MRLRYACGESHDDRGRIVLREGTVSFRIGKINRIAILTLLFCATAWNAPGAALEPVVTPPLGDAWWVQVLIGALIAVGVWLGYWLRVRDIRARNRALEKRLDESTWALQQQTLELERQQQELHALFAAEQRRAEQFQIIAEIGRNVTALLDTNQIITQVARALQHAFDYYHVGIGLIEKDEVVYRAGARVMRDSPRFGAEPDRLKVGTEGLSGWVAARGAPLIVSDVSQDARYVPMAGSVTRSELLVPIIVKEQVIGVLDAQSDQLNAFDDTDRAVMQSIANQTGAAIENARLYERAQELAVMQERNRLARDLHDAVTQTLFSASLLADALPASWENDPAEGRQLLNELRQLSRGALAEMRTLLLELRPAALVETKLGVLLRQLSEAAAGRAGLRVAVNVDGDCKLPAEAHIALYRIAQEALNNILKHSRATNVTVNLNCHAEDDRAIIELAVSDDGRGFDPAQVSPEHFGLRNMRERAQAIGAELSITSQPGQGTRVQVVWQNQEGAQ